MKRLLSLIIALIMIITSVAIIPATVSADTSWTYGGSGTKADPYKITTAAQFTAFFRYITTNSSAYTGKYFRLDTDVAIANANYTFEFDEASGLEKVIEKASGNVLFCLGTGIPGTTYHKGYVNNSTWDAAGTAGSLYTASSLTGALTSYGGTNPLTTWTYLGKANAFRGTFDGNGHTVSGIYLNSAAGDVGFFKGLAGTARIENLTLSNGYVRGGGRNVGGFAGTMDGTSVLKNCTNNLTVCSSATYTGGIVGWTRDYCTPSIIGCINNGAVGGKSTDGVNALTGGIAGSVRSANIISCVNNGRVYGEGNYVGGIVGLLDTGGKDNTYHGTTNMIACGNTGTVVADYMSDGKRAGGWVGGLVGYLDPHWSNEGVGVYIRRSYNVGTVSGGATRKGALIGYCNSANKSADVTIEKCFYKKSELSLISSTPGSTINYLSTENFIITGNEPDLEYIFGKYMLETDEYLAHESFESSYLWYSDNVTKSGMPVPVSADVFGNTSYMPYSAHGTENDPVIIKNLSELTALRSEINAGKHYNGMSFAITADIDLNAGGKVNADGTTTGSVTQWTPIADTNYSHDKGSVCFGGRLVGRKGGTSEKVTLKGLYINSTAAGSKLSGFVGANGGCIENIAFTDSYVKGVGYSSIAAGVNYGTVKDVTVESSVGVAVTKTGPTAIDNYDAPAGAISAVNFGNIENCKNYANISSAYDCASGVAGISYGYVSYSHNYGKVTGCASVGGVVGYMGYDGGYGTAGRVLFCANEGNIEATGSHVGGVVGWSRSGGGIKYSYNAADVKTDGTKNSIIAYSSGAVGGVIGAGNVNNYVVSGTKYVLEGCYNSGKVYRASSTPAASNDIAGGLSGYGGRKLKATEGRYDNSSGIYDGAYVEVSGYEYDGNVKTVPTIDPAYNVAMISAEYVGGNEIKVTFSDTVTKNGNVWASLRCCTVGADGVPSLKYDGKTPIQTSNGVLTLNGTNVGTFTSSELDNIFNGTAWDAYTDGAVLLFSIEGLTGNGNEKGVVDTIVSTDAASVANCYSRYTSAGTTAVTDAQIRSGELCKMMNDLCAGSYFGQNLNSDDHPVLGSSYTVYECTASGGTYTAPAAIPEDNRGMFVGYKAADGKIVPAGASITSGYASAVYRTGLTAVYGASVRAIPEETGIRWTAHIEQNILSDVGEIVSKGFIIVPTAYVTGDYAIVNGKNVKTSNVAQNFTAEALTAKGLKYIDVKVSENDANGDFSASVIHLYDSHYGLEYSARPYVELRYTNGGKTAYIYGGWESANGSAKYADYGVCKDYNARTPSQIATSALADLADKSSADYPYAADGGKFSPYSADLRAVVETYVTGTPVITAPEKNFYPEYHKEEEYSEMKQNIRRWIYNELETGDKALFSAELQSVSAINGANASVSFQTLSSRWTAGNIVSTFDKDGNELISRTYTDSASGLQFVTEATLWADNPTVDFKTTVTNTSTKRSPVIKNLYALNAPYNLASANGNITLHTTIGSQAVINDFDDVEYNLTTSLVSYYPTMKSVPGYGALPSSWGSRIPGSSSSGAWPFFDFIGEGKGLIMAIGWSGTWQADLKKDTNGNVILGARQAHFTSFLEPGEYVETPSIVLTYFDGDAEYGHNVWRQNVLTHYTPDDDTTDGKQEFTAPISFGNWGGKYYKSVDKALENALKYGAKGDCLWFDAGWYSKYVPVSRTDANGNWYYDVIVEGTPGAQEAFDAVIAENPNQSFNSGHDVWASMLGSWSVNSLYYPEGFFDYYGNKLDTLNAQYGTDLKLLVWWMSENARTTTKIRTNPNGTQTSYNNTETWTFPSSYYYTATNYIKLSDETVYQGYLKYFKDRIDEGLDWIRLDNCAGMQSAYMFENNDAEYMRANTSISPNNANSSNNYRMGFTENKFMHNFYRLWEELKEYHPTFLLDNCASGGCRIDIAITKYSIPLWRTDYSYGSDPNGLEAYQHQTQMLSKWLPLTGHGCPLLYDRYNSRSMFSAAVQMSLGNAYAESNAAAFAKVTEEFYETRPFWYGSYYQILEPDYAIDNWQAYELYREDWNEGYLYTIIRTECAESEATNVLKKTLKLKGLVSGGTYLVHDMDDESGINDYRVTGYELMNNGITITGTPRNIICTKLTLVSE